MSRDHARELAAHPRWRWEPGMALDCWGPSVVSGTYREHGVPFGGLGAPDPVIMVECAKLGALHAQPAARCLPDIHHPATRGWLLAWLQRDALAAQVDGHGVWCEWVDGASTRHDHYMGDDALAAALLAVWGAS